MTAAPAKGRRFRHRGRTVRLGDVTPKGRMRLDAVARFLQDVANDDAADAGLTGGDTAWVVRRTMVDALVPLGYGERVEVTTWCSATGSRWAERRTTLAGTDGGFVEAVSSWVHVDLATGLPARLDARFAGVFGPSAAGRTVGAGLEHRPPAPGAVRAPLPLRFADFDVMGHVNNAVYWAVLEDHLAGRGWAGRVRASIEYRTGIGPGEDVELLVTEAVADHGGPAAGIAVWWLVDGEVRASAEARPLDGEAAAGAEARVREGDR